ncbi:MAG: formylglycine-generating enzyme family protein [Treponema porcinum]|uniref:formylglycine-generating enzyme family protein n=1 Tax=Treponema porcinum TaxID=261392 RepID=UPI002356214B|nr:formylglycine-generating enzyme family protein [Treponema porcinum]MCI7080899.1 formylglycine-generating enzyme family protein [Treponema porcinum]MCI7115327.1 formylglycine-generating enzyme family protein [Treponema porcinum]MCI7534836.1 formylglycine-generating enzyme family protein [Treponema porcinum]
MNKNKLIAVLSAMVMSFVFAGCQVESDSHEHSFSKEWTSDDTSHWHAATCEHTEEVSEKTAHTFGEWKTTVETTEETDGKKERTCTVCSYKEEQTVAKLDHTHKFSSDWSSDATNHWHAATCEHTEEVSEKTAHTFGEWKTTVEETEEAEGKKERTCTVCSYNEKKIISKISKGFVKVTGTTITGDETWTPSSYVFVSGRTLTIPDMYVSDHEVTQAEYEKYCKYGEYDSPVSCFGVGDNYPAYFVNWYDAIVYCNLRSIDEGLTPAYKIGEETDPRNWSGIVGDATNGYCGPSSSNSTWNALTYDTEADGYRLPTEAEWEYIAREANTSSTIYSGSDTIDDVAWYTSNSSSKTHEVKGKNANSLGIYDMSGNVWEWCYDWYSSSINSSTADTGASSGSHRVERGGSWYFSASDCTVSARNRYDPNYRNNYRGFRVVRSAY